MLNEHTAYHKSNKCEWWIHSRWWYKPQSLKHMISKIKRKKKKTIPITMLLFPLLLHVEFYIYIYIYIYTHTPNSSFFFFFFLIKYIFLKNLFNRGIRKKILYNLLFFSFHLFHFSRKPNEWIFYPSASLPSNSQPNWKKKNLFYLSHFLLLKA